MGEGKGKTTAAVGLAVRFAGSGQSVMFTQFLKPGNSGELAELEDMEHVQVFVCPSEFGFTSRMNEEEKAQASSVYEEYLMTITRLVLQGDFGMLVMDEVIAACSEGIIEESLLMDCLDQLPDDMEVVLTGRYPSDAMLDRADYITEMKKIRHPFDKGVQARRGIEY